MISIKDTSVLISILTIRYHQILIDIVAWLDNIYGRTVITCGYRPNDKGGHGTDPCTGIDVRSWVFSNPLKVVGHINNEWIYDPRQLRQKVAIIRGTKSEKHIHLRCCSRTKRRKPT